MFEKLCGLRLLHMFRLRFILVAYGTVELRAQLLVLPRSEGIEMNLKAESGTKEQTPSRPHIGTRIALRNMLAATRATISLITHSPFSAALGGFYTAIADTGGLYRSRALVMGIRVTSHRISNHKRPLRHKACVHITSASGRMAQWQTAKYVETNTTRPL